MLKRQISKWLECNKNAIEYRWENQGRFHKFGKTGLPMRKNVGATTVAESTQVVQVCSISKEDYSVCQKSK